VSRPLFVGAVNFHHGVLDGVVIVNYDGRRTCCWKLTTVDLRLQLVWVSFFHCYCLSCSFPPSIFLYFACVGYYCDNKGDWDKFGEFILTHWLYHEKLLYIPNSYRKDWRTCIEL